MATLVAPIASLAPRQDGTHMGGDRRLALVLVSALTIFSVAINGYHPFAEDGGLYIAGIERLLDPSLFVQQTEFVLAPMRFSLFAPLVAALVRCGPIGLAGMLLVLHLVSIWTTLFAAWMLAARCWSTRSARAGAVLLTSCWLALPVAGTALSLMDPYLTPRSFSTPCTLLALVGALDLRRGCRSSGGGALLIVSLLLAASMHPLMAAYAAFAVGLLMVVQVGDRRVRVALLTATVVGVLLVAGVAMLLSPTELAAYGAIAQTRSYWFLAHWTWYELVGLAAPIAILWGVWRTARKRIYDRRDTQRSLAQMAVLAGSIAFCVAIFFARESLASSFPARLQPLRMFHIVYLVMTISLGGLLGEHILQRKLWRWCAVAAVLGSTMFGIARESFSNSQHLEIPGRTSPNAWVQAFTWIRENTPKDALFAIDADYINASGEDAQCFRAIAQRSVLPDYSKDGGEASIAPALTPLWIAGQEAQRNLTASSTTDSMRLSALRPMGVTWLVLQSQTATALDCPYANGAVKVCRLLSDQRAK